MTKEYEPLSKVHEILNGNDCGDTSYQANIDPICQFLQSIERPIFQIDTRQILKVIQEMLDRDPLKRPSLSSFISRFSLLRRCCQLPADALEADRELKKEEDSLKPPEQENGKILPDGIQERLSTNSILDVVKLDF